MPPPSATSSALRSHYPMLVVGAGAAGLSHALALHPVFGEGLAVLEAKSLVATRPLGRCLALTQSSLDFLRTLCPAFVPHTHITHVHVRRTEGFGHLCLEGEPNLGASVREGHVLDALHTRLQACNIALHDACAVARLHAHRYGVQLVLEDGRMITADHVVLAEGGQGLWLNSNHYIEKDYQQSAWTMVLEVSQAAPAGHAFEWLTPYGACAWIPLGGARYGVVWIRAHDDPPRDVQALMRVFFRHFGTIHGCEPVRVFPLRARYTQNSVHGRIILAGHSAHMLHPIAAQGFNLSLRDAYDLAQSFSLPQRQWTSALEAYSQRRWVDLKRTLGLTSMLNELLHPRVPLPQGLGLAALDACTPLKKYMTQCLTMTSSS